MSKLLSPSHARKIHYNKHVDNNQIDNNNSEYYYCDRSIASLSFTGST
jgi:hypothetical protein